MEQKIIIIFFVEEGVITEERSLSGHGEWM